MGESSLCFPDGTVTFRLRSTDTVNPFFLSTAAETATADLTHFVFTRSSNGERKIYKNGVEIAADILGGDFSNWDSSMRFQIANEFGGSREWLGTYYLTSVYDRALDSSEVVGNYDAGVDSDVAPAIVIEPNDLGLVVGQPAVFSVKIVGDSSSYKWRKNGSDILGATDFTYTIPSVTLSDDGDIYSCVVSNSFGSDTSRDARLSVTALDSRVTGGQLALYTLQEGVGDTIKDVSGYGAPVNLKIYSPLAVQWKSYGLNVISNADIYSIYDTSKINNEVIANGEFTFEAWIKPENISQLNATILTIRPNNTLARRNFAMNQEGNLLQSWLRATSTPDEGDLLSSPTNSLGDSLVHIVYTHNPKELSKIFINGTEVSDSYIVGDLSSWRPDYWLRLANNFSADQPWKGLYNLVSFYGRALSSNEISHNYSIGPLGIGLQAPDSLTAQANQPGKIELAWQDSSNNEDGFIIERRHGVFDFTSIDSVTANVTSYTDSSVIDTTNYTYRVKAYNLINQSSYSNTASAITLLSTVAAPSNLTAILSPTIVNHAQLTWQDNSSNELGFILERKTGDSASVEPFIVLDTLTADVTSFEDSTLADTTTYTFRVKAFNAFTESDYSNLASVTTVLSTLDAPTDLTANLSSTIVNRAQLTWQDNSSNELGFIVERKTGDSASVEPFSVLDTLAADITSFEDSTLADTTTYTFRVKTFNAFTESGYSNLAWVTTILSIVAAPGNLTAIVNPADTNNVLLSWVDNSLNELGFIIERKTGDSSSVDPYLVIDSVAADVISYEDTTVADTTTYTYRVQGFNEFVVSNFRNQAEVTTPVPVELTSFTASVADKYVQLDWETATELNNAGFSIQRSKDNNKFIDLIFVKGKGTTTTQSLYSYTDKSVLSGKYYYRLKQVDFDGSVTFSESTKVDLGVPKDYALEQNYPNPFNPSTTIRFALPINARVIIKLYNALGQEVITILNTDLDAGIHETVFNASNLSSGVYFYMLKVQGANNSNFTSTKRMILMK